MARRDNYRRNIGSVSSGTMRPEDLIPSFVWELKQMKPCRHRKLVREIEKDLLNNRLETDEDWAGEILDELFNALDSYSLPGFYFGAHPGDGADYGFWLSETFQEDFDGLKVSDTSAVPYKYRGEVLHINDHGNMTLYYASRGHLTEIWSLV